MMNTRVYCSSLALLGCLVSCLGAPVVFEETVYDQRQNGSENFRVHVDGVVIVHAPLEALVALASLSDDSGLQQQLLEILGSAGGNATEEPTVLASTSTTPNFTTTTVVAEESTPAAIAADADASNFTTAAPEKTGESIKPHKKTKFSGCQPGQYNGRIQAFGDRVCCCRKLGFFHYIDLADIPRICHK